MALDSRVHSLASVSGFDPLRLGTADRGVSCGLNSSTCAGRLDLARATTR